MIINYLLAASAPAIDYREIEREASFPPFDVASFTGQLIWLVATFLPLYFVMSRFVLPQLDEVLDARKKLVSDGLTSALAAQEQAKLTALKYEAAIMEAKKQADAEAFRLTQETRRWAKSRRKEVEAELAQRLQEAQRQIEKASADVVKRIPDMAKETTADIIEWLVSEKLHDKQLTVAVTRALNDQHLKWTDK